MANEKHLRAMSAEERKRKIEMTLKAIEKEHGIGASQVLGTAKPVPLARTHSGSYYINEVLGGGYPRGRIIEIFGPESSGKTTIALHAVAEIQKKGGLAVYIDAEHALDLNYAQDLGVDVQELIVGQPDTAEDCLQVTEKWIRSGVAEVIVVDSVAAMVPKAELEGDIGDNHMGLMSRLMSQALRKLAGLALRNGTIIIFINQLREKIGVMFGNPETTTGGRALKFYASIRLDVRPKAINTKEDVAVSRKTQVKAVKNKVAPPFRSVEVDIEFGKGVSKSGEIVDMGAELGIVKKSGAWYSYYDANGEELRLAQGRENAKKKLEEDVDLMNYLDSRICEMMYPTGIVEDVDFIPQELEDIEATLVETTGDEAE